MRRRLVFLLLGCVALVVVVLATLPLWLGSALGTFGPGRGLTFASYERLGYGRFALRDVVFQRQNVRVTASRLEAPSPLVWGWRHWRGGENPIAVERWMVEVTKSTAPAKTPATHRGWVPLRLQLQRIAGQLERWLPVARTGPGTVRWPGGEIKVAGVDWSNRRLNAKELSYRALVANAQMTFGRDDQLDLAAQFKDGTSLALHSAGPRVSGEVTWQQQRATVQAQFPPRGWLPTEAEVNAQEWALPGAALKLGEVYATVRGNAVVRWSEQRFSANVQAASEPSAGKSAPPLKLDLRGEGDAQAFTVQALTAEIPGISARLTEPVTVERSGQLRGEGARLELKADLAQQPWFAATGAITGEARVRSGGERMPVVDFQVDGRALTAKELNLAQLGARGQLAWPRLEVATGVLAAGEGERLEWRGGYDFKTKEILAAVVDGQIRRQSLARWLPKQPNFDVVTIALRASGTMAELQHEGSVAAGEVTVNGVKPMAVRVTWSGRGIGAERFDAVVTAGGSTLRAQGSATRDAARLTALELVQSSEARLKLTGPATVTWKPTLHVDNLQLKGPEGTLSLAATTGETGNVEFAAGNISSRWFSDFLPEKGPAWQLRLVALMGRWDGGAMNFSLSAGASVEIGEGRMAAVHASARGDAEGVRIEALRATEGDATVVNATGRLPVTFHPGTARALRIEETGAVELNATAAPNAAFWQKLAAVSGVELKEPDAAAAVTGTWRRPEGQVTLKAARVGFDPKRFARPLPAIENIDVRVAGDQRGVILDTFAFTVEGQPVRAQGRLPVPEGDWKQLTKEPLAVARRAADFSLEVPEAEVAVFARFLPAVLAPQGRIAANVTFKQGQLGGFVRLRNAASKPLGPLGVLQEIEADIELKGQTLVLQGVNARSGGQPVRLSGTVELPDVKNGSDASARGGPAVLPKFDLALKGDNLPFVRQTGLLLRGDLDLKLQTPASGPVRLSGVVRLRDSLFLADVRAFLPQGGGGPKRRPPYFSVDTPPMNTWVLAVEVVGEDFMRLRTPVFAGVASAHFRLGGTLGEPRAIGEVEIEEGAVRMPFARFEVQQGAVRLTEADPYEPTIYLRGTGRRYGYDLALEIEGKASAPNVVFSSSPALESEQVLLMVMTGAAPTQDQQKTATDRVAGLGVFLGSSIFGTLSGNAGEPDRLNFSSTMSREGEELYEVEYRLSDRWAITLETTEYDDKILGAKWRWLRGEKKREGSGKPEENAREK